MNHKDQKLVDFFRKNREKVNNPIIKSFLASKENLSLVEKAIMDPSYINREKVDKAFQEHYQRIRKIKYISNLIYFFSIDYDKKVKKHKERALLVLDKELSGSESITLKDVISEDNQDMDSFVGNNIFETIEDELLMRAIKSLPQKQIQILDMIYHKELPLKEIATKLQTTPQNISNHHRKALKKLKQILNKEWYSGKI
ncbi:sigma-70 family RNA polymerase sigma factor [Ornithinibacillus scapharcae]|uniref:sigma-70 family RNA polymerase sigma factor n=1 Tax=Ornithinibacillus scapharcae TaxID=1147159 RepID=UPI000225B07F|nr:sigma-70 family RNA polymerase sigma factor [Ornithinibacillus scapharcae]